MFRAKAQSFGRELAASPVARALAISLLAHFVLISGMEIGRQAGWWKHSLLPQSAKSRLQQVMEETEQQRKQAQQVLQNQIPEAQLVFVEVDPAAAIPEPPKDTKYYSSRSSIAANPDAGEKETPRIDGEQEKVVKTFDTLKPNPNSLQPQPREPKPEVKPQPKPPETKAPERPAIEEDVRPPRDEKPGETLVARAAPKPQTAQPEQKPEPRRPRTLAEAKAQKGIIEGQRMRQDGGTRRPGRVAFDVKATPFGAYDQAFIEAVQSRWFNLLDERQFMPNEAGKVVLEFRLNYDGRITALRVVESEVNEHLSWTCQRAVLDPGPYRPFPSDMRRLVNNDYREIRFTFYYNQ